jgi:Geobacter CxxxxCH...CXXCH motif (GSu_C4xC__C2xCH)
MDAIRKTLLRSVVVSSVALLYAGCGGPDQEPSARSDALTVSRPAATPFIPFNSSTTAPGVHVKHATIACSACHLQGGAVQFDPKGPAVIPGTLKTDSHGVVIVDPLGNVTVLQPTMVPTYTPGSATTATTCSNISCHWIPPGDYTAPDADWFGDTDPYAYGSAPGSPTPDWYTDPSTVNDCAACHSYPPYSSGGLWHSGWHGNVNINSAPNKDLQGLNSCSTCHPDVSTTITGTIGTSSAAMVTTISNPSMHPNGAIDVTYPNGRYPCAYCH